MDRYTLVGLAMSSVSSVMERQSTPVPVPVPVRVPEAATERLLQLAGLQRGRPWCSGDLGVAR